MYSESVRKLMAEEEAAALVAARREEIGLLHTLDATHAKIANEFSSTHGSDAALSFAIVRLFDRVTALEATVAELLAPKSSLTEPTPFSAKPHE
jgi:hypothetical protein